MGSGGGLSASSLVGDVAATVLVAATRLVLGLIVALALLATGPVVAGVTSTVVMSDSMAPGIRAGDVVLVTPSLPADVLGRVVLADDPDLPGRLRLHRVVRVDGGRLVLKGDANRQSDSATVAGSAVHGVGFLRVPAIGLPVLWARAGAVLPLAAALVGLLLVGATIAILDPGSVPVRARHTNTAAADAAG